MKKILTIVGVIMLFGTIAYAQSSGTVYQLNPWRLSGTTITPVKNTNSLTVPSLGGSGTKCIHVDNNGLFGTAAADCGTGGGGSGGGTWSTTTSSVSGRLINYPNNTTDIVNIGSSATTTGKFWFDPNVQNSYLASSTIPNLQGNKVNIANSSTSVSYAGGLTNSNFNNFGWVKAYGNYAYGTSYGSSFNGILSVIDVKNPTQPKLTGQVSLSCTGAEGIEVLGNYAYIVCYTSNKFIVVDISNPSSPTVVSTLTDSTNLNGAQFIFIAGNYAYVTSIVGNNLAVLDISNPRSPVVVESFTTANMSGPLIVKVLGKYAYVTNYAGEYVNIIDVSNPTNLTLAADLHLGSGNNSAGIDFKNNYAYISPYGASAELYVADISNPSSPVLVSSLTFSSAISGALVAVNNNNLYTTGFSTSFNVFDISSSTNPTLVTKLTNPKIQVADDIVLSGNYAYLTDQTSNTFNVIDLSGINTSSIQAGSISSQRLNVGDFINTQRLFAQAGISVGSFGIFNQGSIISSTTVSNQFIGTTTATSTSKGGWDISGGCFAVNGTCITSGGSQTPWTSNIDGGTYTLTNVSQITASTYRGTGYGGIAPTYVYASDTDTGFGGDNSGQINVWNNGAINWYFDATGKLNGSVSGSSGGITTAGVVTASSFTGSGTATSTLAGGLNVTSGCVAVSGTCIGSGSGVTGGTAGMLAAFTSATALTATGTPTAAAYVATSSTATSTFAGGLTVETTGFVYDRSTNRVGIGTASPTFMLDATVTNAASDGARFSNTNGSTVIAMNRSATGVNGAFRFQTATSDQWDIGLPNDGTNNLRIVDNQNNIPRMYIKRDSSGGFIGIGTTSPTAKVHINPENATYVPLKVTGYVSQSANLFEALDVSNTVVSSISSVGTGSFLNGSANGALRIGANVNAAGTLSNSTRKVARVVVPTYSNASNNAAIFSADFTSGTQNNLFFGAVPGGSSYGTNNIFFSTTPSDSFTGAAASTSIAIVHNVGVGIGNGYVSSFSGAAVNPSAALSVLDFPGSVKNMFQVSSSTGSVAAPTAVPVLTIPYTGNVGIGTTSPYTQLAVVGTTSSTRIIQGSNIVSSYLYPSFSYSTSTAWTGTTTIPLGVAFNGETWRAVKCFTDTGTLNVSIYDGTNRMNMFNASTTVGNVTLSTNNTFTSSEKRYVDIGTPASSPTKLSCTVQKTLDTE